MLDGSYQKSHTSLLYLKKPKCHDFHLNQTKIAGDSKPSCPDQYGEHPIGLAGWVGVKNKPN